MLTDSERAWLKRRSKSKYCQGKYCPWCPIPLLDCSDMCVEGRCPTRGGDMGDAAEFEAMVAKKLAFMAVNRSEESPCHKRSPCDPVSCYSCWLKTARLEVEEEMDADGQ